MKIGGVDPSTMPNEEILVIPRGESNIVFRAKGLPDMDEFNAQVAEPKMPTRLEKGGYVPDPMDAGYQSVLAEYNKRRWAYLVIKTLAPSEIEWDTVNMDSPGTWANWEADMKTAGLTQVECNLIFKLVLEANSLDSAKLEKARALFLQGPPPTPAQ